MREKGEWARLVRPGLCMIPQYVVEVPCGVRWRLATPRIDYYLYGLRIKVVDFSLTSHTMGGRRELEVMSGMRLSRRIVWFSLEDSVAQAPKEVGAFSLLDYL